MVIHLAGESIASGRWTEAKKARIRESRVHGTRVLAHALAGLPAPPELFLCASAIGYYGHRGDEKLTEASPPGGGFLADVVKAWEEASLPAAQAGIRTVNVRFGMVLSGAGGALQKMMRPFLWGLGGRFGTGEQYMSWVAIDDLVRAVLHAMLDDRLHGPVNVVSPQPVTNLEFTHTLARVLRRPAIWVVPKPILRALWPEMADALFLASTRAFPKVLAEHGFTFCYSELENALRHVLKKHERVSEAVCG